MTEHPNSILHRCAGGIVVDACYMPITQVAGISVASHSTGETAWTSVHPSKLVDAFNHPMVYLNPDQVSKLGVA